MQKKVTCYSKSNTVIVSYRLEKCGWVRWYRGNLHCYVIIAMRYLIGVLAQLVRALAWHARGRRFESAILHHNCLSRTTSLLVRGVVSCFCAAIPNTGDTYPYLKQKNNIFESKNILFTLIDKIGRHLRLFSVISFGLIS